MSDQYKHLDDQPLEKLCNILTLCNKAVRKEATLCLNDPDFTPEQVKLALQAELICPACVFIYHFEYEKPYYIEQHVQKSCAIAKKHINDR